MALGITGAASLSGRVLEMVKPGAALRAAALVLAVLSVTPAAHAGHAKIRDGKDVLRAMHDRYQHDWYETLTFEQTSTTHNPDGTSKSEIWHEAAMLPGSLRIDIGDPSQGNGALVADGTMTRFRDGKVAMSRPFVHMLLVLGFDVYRQPAQRTIEQVAGQDFDLTKLHADTWAGTPVYVVGADAGDMKTRQFWIERKRLLFVRIIEPDQNDNSKTDDIRFMDYRKVSPGWVAARVELYVDGKNTFSERYADIRVNPKLDPASFDPRQFTKLHWEK
jgi:outer membrane lipoprotein-sorting protein